MSNDTLFDMYKALPGARLPFLAFSKEGFNHSIIRSDSDKFFYFFEYQSSQVEIRKCDHIDRF